jgi:hypothetical protein
MMAVRLYDKLKHAIRYWLLRHLPPCEQMVQALSQSMERQLSLIDRIKVKLHLWICAWCQWYLEHLLVIRDASRIKGRDYLPETDTRPGLSAEARERIKRNLTN